MPVECRLPGCTIAVNAQRQAASERRGEGGPELDRWSASSHPGALCAAASLETSFANSVQVPAAAGTFAEQALPRRFWPKLRRAPQDVEDRVRPVLAHRKDCGH